MADNAAFQIEKRIRELNNQKLAIDIAIRELSSVLSTIGGSPQQSQKSLDEMWGTNQPASSSVPASTTGAMTADGRAPEVVASPKTGTPVATPASTLKAKLRGGNGRK